MYTFLTDIQDTWFGGSGHLHYFMIFFMFVWFVWLSKAIASRFYRGWSGGTDIGDAVAVIIPVVDESPELFGAVLDRITAQEPDELIVVINGARNWELERLCRDRNIRYSWTEKPGKRHAIQVGVECTTAPIVVLVDSDTLWQHDTLAELRKPFHDSTIGGVTTSQRIENRLDNVLTRFADTMENVRIKYSMPSMSVFGQVGCLPGRTIAFRRAVLVDNMERFMTERFLGVHIEVSDDRTLTNFALRDGWRTVFQSTSKVTTQAPVTLRKYARQQYRWARGSQYNTLRMLPFMLRRARFLAMLYLADLIMPFFFGGVLVNIFWKVVFVKDPAHYQFGLADRVLLILCGMLVGFAIRNAPHFLEHPDDIKYAPVFILLQTFVLIPLRLLGFFNMAKDASWGTRSGGFAGRTQESHIYRLLPRLYGALLIAVFGSAGPLVETRGIFLHDIERAQVATVARVLVVAFVLAALTALVLQIREVRDHSLQTPPSVVLHFDGPRALTHLPQFVRSMHGEGLTQSGQDSARNENWLPGPQNS